MNKMLSIKTVILSLVLIPFFYSCSKKEGCNFNEALNYDSDVVIDDGSCTFTNFTFYADTTYYNGIYIEQVDVRFGRELIGSFTGMETEESACGGANTTSYMPSTVENISWTSEIHLLDSLIDTVIFTSGEARTSPNIECLEIDVLQ